MILFIAHGVGMGVGGPTVFIDGVASIDLTAQYENAMIGSDQENNKWDVLSLT